MNLLDMLKNDKTIIYKMNLQADEEHTLIKINGTFLISIVKEIHYS